MTDAPNKGGRPRYFDPSPAQAAKLRELWEGPYVRVHVQKVASDMVGKPVEYHHLRDWYARVTAARSGQKLSE